MDELPASPCIGICIVDPATRQCRGCLRLLGLRGLQIVDRLQRLGHFLILLRNDFSGHGVFFHPVLRERRGDLLFMDRLRALRLCPVNILGIPVRGFSFRLLEALNFVLRVMEVRQRFLLGGLRLQVMLRCFVGSNLLLFVHIAARLIHQQVVM